MKTDVLVIGGSAAGLVAAIAGHGNYPDKDFLLVRKEEKVMVPCGIPYIFGTLEGSNQNVMPDAMLEKAGVPIKVGEVTEINTAKKLCKMADGEVIE